MRLSVFPPLALRLDATVRWLSHGNGGHANLYSEPSAVVQGRAPDDVAADWNLGRGEIYEPDRAVDAEAIRAAYGEICDRLS